MTVFCLKPGKRPHPYRRSGLQRAVFQSNSFRRTGTITGQKRMFLTVFNIFNHHIIKELSFSRPLRKVLYFPRFVETMCTSSLRLF